MSKFNIGDKVTIANPAYIVTANDPKGYVSAEAFGKTAEVIKVIPEGTRDDIIGTAYQVQVTPGLAQTISQHYLTEVVEEPETPTLADGVYKETGAYPDTVLVRDGKVVEVLIATDGCVDEISIADHLSWFQAGDHRLEDLVRLVAPGEPKPEPLLDGIYVDSEGDIVQIKDGKARDLQSPRGTVYSIAYYEEPIYHPYRPVVLETEVTDK